MPLESSSPVTAIYPGTFDPVTNGHLDLIQRGARERADMIESVTFNLKNVQVDVFDGLLVDYARAKNARVILRGIRAVSDYEYELQMAMMNRKLEPDVETVFMLPSEQYSHLSSRLIKELARLNGQIKDFVPSVVLERLKTKFH